MDVIKYQNWKSITIKKCSNVFSFRIIILILSMLCTFILISQPILSTNSYNTIQIHYALNKSISHLNPHLDMLIFLSPQYRNDTEIVQSIKYYSKIIKENLNWSTKLIKIDNEENNFTKIDAIIEDYYDKYQIKACIMIGEDIDTPVAGHYENMTNPSTIPWATIGNYSKNQTNSNQIISTCIKPKIFISLIFPQKTLSYNNKQVNIIKTLEKFANNRNHTMNQSITVLESSDVNIHTKNRYQEISPTLYLENPSKKQLLSTLNSSNSIYLIHGHSNPSKTILNEEEKTIFSVHQLQHLKVPVFLADGCYVNGFWNQNNDKNQSKSYSHIITENPNIHIMILGMIYQYSNTKTNDSLELIIKELYSGKTIAESVINKTISGDIVFYGDPTFSF